MNSGGVLRNAFAMTGKIVPNFVDSAGELFTRFCKGAGSLRNDVHLVAKANMFLYKRECLTFTAAKTAGKINVANVQGKRIHSLENASLLSLWHRPKFDFDRLLCWHTVLDLLVPTMLCNLLALGQPG